MKFIVITDCHVVPDGRTAHDLDPGARLRQAITDINRLHADATGCIFLGDLTEDGTVGSYAYLKEIVSGLAIPTHFALGNHDDRSAFRAVFGTAPFDVNGFVQSVIDDADVRLIILDSLDQGVHSGRLCANRLEWLEFRLSERPDTPVTIFLHHHPCAIDMAVDEVMLKDADEFRAVLARHANVAHVFSGHTHRTCSGLWGRIPFATLGPTHYVTTHHFRDSDYPVERTAETASFAILTIETDRVLVHSHHFLATRIVA